MPAKKPQRATQPANSTNFQAFEDHVAPELCRMEGTCTESQVVAHLRDVFLPKLISGDIRPSEAARAVEAQTSGPHD